MNRFVLQDTA